MNLKSVFIVWISVLILSACGGSQSAIKDKDLKTETLKAIVKNYNNSTPKYKTMRGRLKGDYEDSDQRQNINISYRFKKDKALWMSAKFAGFIQVAKMMITPKKIMFYERIDNSFFDGNFELVSSFLGLELNYNQIQNLFTGQALREIEISKTDFQTTDQYFLMETTFDNGLHQRLLLDAKTFKIKEQILSLKDTQVKILYNEYQMIGKSSFPKEFVILAGKNEDQVRITLTYKNIKLNDKLRFPFSFPNNYTPIQLN